MADPKRPRACPLCGAAVPGGVTRANCASCGGLLAGTGRRRLDELEGARRHGFSALWCVIAVAVASILTVAVVAGLPMVVPAFDFEGSAGMLLAIGVWFVSGMLVGLMSPGHTLWEPVVATVLVAGPTAFSLFQAQTVKVMPVFMYVLLSGLGVLFALIGSHVGELLQLGPSTSRPD